VSGSWSYSHDGQDNARLVFIQCQCPTAGTARW